MIDEMYVVWSGNSILEDGCGNIDFCFQQRNARFLEIETWVEYSQEGWNSDQLKKKKEAKIALDGPFKQHDRLTDRQN